MIGVTPLIWVRGTAKQTDGVTTTTNSSFDSVTNITTLQAKQLLSGGINLSQLTGNSADQGIGVYAFGRDEDAGQRVTTFAEAGFYNNPTQYLPVSYNPLNTHTISGITLSVSSTIPSSGSRSGVITGYLPSPKAIVDGILWDYGHGGYSSANTQVTDVSRTVLSSLNSFFIGYSSIDNASVIANGAVALSWNGVPYSVANVQQGKYTFWSYSHLLWRNGLSAVAQNALALLATQIRDVDAAQGGVLVGSLAVERSAEGEPVTFGNSYAP